MLVMEAERFGGPQVLTARQVPDPVAGPGQVVLRTSAADVLFAPDRSRAPAPPRRHPDLTAVSGALTPETAVKAASTRPSPLRPARHRSDSPITTNLLRPDLSV